MLQVTVKQYYKLRQLYYKLRQCVITNYGSFITNYGKMLLQITAALLQITTMCYYKLRQLYQIITNYCNTSLQITAGITNYDVTTNYGVTNFGHTLFFCRAGNTEGVMTPSPHPPPPPPPTHTHTHKHTLCCVTKRKKGKQRKKRKGFKAETINRLSPRSKYYCFSNSRASRNRKCFFLANHGGRQCYMAPPLSNPFRLSCFCLPFDYHLLFH